MTTRIGIGSLGVLLGLYGVFRIVTEVKHHALFVLVVWLVAAVVLHDAVLSPGLVGVGAAIRRFVPPRARPFVQGGLAAAALVTVIALPLIHRQGLYPASKALLRQDYRVNLLVLLGVILAVTVVLYAIRVARSRPSTTKQRPSSDHDSTTT